MSFKKESAISINRQVLIRASMVAGVVGPLLTIINQWNGLFGTGTFSFLQFGLTMLVPFCVSSISSFLTSKKFIAIISGLKQENSDREADLEALRIELEALNDEALKAADTLHSPASSSWGAQGETNQSYEVHHPKIEISDNHGGIADHQDNLNAAISVVKSIQTNATKVNTSSVERVSFISKLIERAENVNYHVNNLSTENNESKASIEQVGSSIEEISVSVKNLSEDVAHSVEALRDMTAVAEDFQKQFGAVRIACERIDELSSTINMVSINAAIEAARQGEAGQGFSLIAGEIRTLSDRSKQDLEQIFSQIRKVENSFTNLTSSMETVTEKMSGNHETSRVFKERTEALCDDIAQFSQRLLQVSKVTAEQLPAVTRLVDDIRQIKANTEAAVTGSQTNINLCKETIGNLNSILASDDRATDVAA